jgi:hypothetical protein
MAVAADDGKAPAKARQSRAVARLALASWLCALALPAPAQANGYPPAAGAATPARPAIVALGASLTHGLDLAAELERRKMGGLIAAAPAHRKSSIGLGALLARVAPAPVVDGSDLYFFAGPAAHAARQVEVAANAQPELVVAVDFLFWFGYWPNERDLDRQAPASDLLQAYGSADREIEKALRSLEKQALGLDLLRDLLARTKATVVVGDYPDMYGANPLMLNPKRIPLRRTLDELNRRLREFAKDQPRLVLYPLADYVTRAKEGKLTLPDGSGRTLTVESAIQIDQLHPTRLGTALVMHELYGLLAERLGADVERLLGPRPTFAELAERAGAKDELALVEAPVEAGK